MPSTAVPAAPVTVESSWFFLSGSGLSLTAVSAQIWLTSLPETEEEDILFQSRDLLLVLTSTMSSNSPCLEKTLLRTSIVHLAVVPLDIRITP